MPKKTVRTPKQKAATRKMLAANKASRKAAAKASKPKKKVKTVAKRRTPAQKAATKKLIAYNKRKAKGGSGKRRKSNPAKKKTTSKRRTSRRGKGLIAPIAGTVLGASAAVGAAALLNLAASATKIQLPAVVKDYAPIAGALVVAGLATQAKQFKTLARPALIGGVAMVALQMWLKSRMGAGYHGAGRYNKLSGAGNVSRVLGNMPSGSGNVARVIARMSA